MLQASHSRDGPPAPLDDEGAGQLRRRGYRTEAPSTAAAAVQQQQQADVAATAAADAAMRHSADPWTLAFRDKALEADFVRHHAVTMLRTDFASCIMHVVFYCILLYTPGPLGHLAWKLPWTTVARGFAPHVLPMPLMLIPLLRPW